MNIYLVVQTIGIGGKLLFCSRIREEAEAYINNARCNALQEANDGNSMEDLSEEEYNDLTIIAAGSRAYDLEIFEAKVNGDGDNFIFFDKDGERIEISEEIITKKLAECEKKV